MIKKGTLFVWCHPHMETWMGVSPKIIHKDSIKEKEPGVKSYNPLMAGTDTEP